MNKKLLRSVREYKKQSVLAPVLVILEVLMEVLIPLEMAKIIDVGIANGSVSYVVRMGGLLLLLAIIGLTCSLTAQYFAAKAATGTATALRNNLFSHIGTLSYTEIDTIGTSTLITRMTSDINQVQNGINMTLRLLLRSPFVVFGAMVMAFTVDAHTAMVFAVTIPVLCVVIFGIMLISMPLYQSVQRQLDKVLLTTRENLMGVRVIRAFNRQENEREKFEEENGSLVKMQVFVGKISALLNPVTYVIINIATVAVIWVGATRVDAGIISQGKVIALVNYMAQILVELIKMANLIILISKAVACMKRVDSVFEIKSSIEEKSHETKTQNAENEMETTQKISPETAKMEFDHVDFSYKKDSKEPVLKDINLSIRAGETIGIIGGTGSSKSTLIQLISRLYDTTEGVVKVGGRDVREYDLKTLRNQVAVVLQKNILFSGTIEENLRWGDKNATPEEIAHACKLAQADEFVLRFPDKYKSYIEQGGANVSGGQKQRLCIARALLKKPKILILDDSTSAVDTKTDAMIRSGFKEFIPETTKIIIAQRISSVQEADHIIVMDGGKIQAVGNHEELMKASPIYREVYESQNKGGGQDEE